MARTKKYISSSKEVPESMPSMTPEAQESKCIALAVDLAEKQLREGTASSQVITHYLKLGSAKERLEQEKLAKENLLIDAKVEALKSAKQVEALYSEALNAMRRYSGMGGDIDDV